jgi:hypothetical protein
MAQKDAVAALLRMNTFAKIQDYFLETALEAISKTPKKCHSSPAALWREKNP